MGQFDDLARQLAEIQRLLDEAEEKTLDPCSICELVAGCNAVVGSRDQFQTATIKLLCELNEHLQTIAETGGGGGGGGCPALCLDGSNQALWIPTNVLVPNLNADLLDGLQATAFAAAAHNHDALYLQLSGANQAAWTPTNVLVTNLNADLLDGQHAAAFAAAVHNHDGVYIRADGTTALTANWDAGGYEIRAETFESDVATGTAPFTVASTTLVTNLNADLLDGQHGAYYAAASALGDYIEKDGTTTTTATIPFAEGLWVPLDTTIGLGGSGTSKGYLQVGDTGIITLSGPGAAGGLSAAGVVVQAGTCGSGWDIGKGSDLELRGGFGSIASGDVYIDGGDGVMTHGNVYIETLIHGHVFIKSFSGILIASLGRVDVAVADTDYLTPGTAATTYIAKDGTTTTTAAIPFAVGLSLPDAQSAVFGTDSDASITHSGSAFTVDNATGYTLFNNDDLTAQSAGQQRFVANWTPTSGGGGSHWGNLFDATVDWRNIVFNTSSTIYGNRFNSTFESFVTVSPFPLLTYYGTAFINTFHGNQAGQSPPIQWSSSGLTGVLFDIDYTGNFVTHVGGMNIFPMIVDVDLTATIIGSHQISGLEVYTTYNAANSTNQLYGIRSEVEAKGGVTVSGSFDAFYGKQILASGGATLRNDAAVYRAVSTSTYETYFNAQLAAGKKLYGFYHDAALFNMASRECVSFGSNLPADANNYALQVLAQGWFAADSIKLLFGAGKDAELYVASDDFYIRNVTSNKDIIFSVNDGGAQTTLLTLDADVPRLATAVVFQSTLATGTAPFTIASTTLCTNLNADLLDGSHASAFATSSHNHDSVYLKINGTTALTANWDAGSYEIRAQTLYSDVAVGTSPLTVTSTTMVSNFNADRLDGFHATGFAARDGSQWTRLDTSGNRSWQAIASSSDGTKLVAVVYGGYVYTSTDSGATWTEQTGSGSRNWRGIASSSDGTKLAATVDSGYIYTSTDSGVNWTEQTDPGSRAWLDIASSSDGAKLVAIIDSGYIYTSTDSGVNWTEQTDAGSHSWKGVASSSDGTNLAIAANGGYIYTSTDSGVNWTEQTAAGSRNWSSIASSSDGTFLVASYATGYIYTSTDSGSSWTQQTAAGERVWRWVSCSSDGQYILAIVNNGYAYLSCDFGVTWAEQTAMGTGPWHRIASATGKFILSSYGGYIFTLTPTWLALAYLNADLLDGYHVSELALNPMANDTFFKWEDSIGDPADILSLDDDDDLFFQNLTGGDIRVKTDAGTIYFHRGETASWQITGADGHLEPVSDVNVNIGKIDQRVNYIYANYMRATTFEISGGALDASGAGVGTVKMNGATSRDCDKLIPFKHDGTTYYIPAWATITG